MFDRRLGPSFSAVHSTHAPCRRSSHRGSSLYAIVATLTRIILTSLMLFIQVVWWVTFENMIYSHYAARLTP